jgi:class 3 adenylate cyclase
VPQPTRGMSTQTRGFLFADLRGYSAYTERRGDDAARELLRRYRALVREVIARRDGAEIRTEGDSFYVVFGSVTAAVLAGVEIQAESATASGATPSDPIRVGVGIHAGETTDDAEEGIVSSAVNIAARVCAVADPGEVLVTDTVRALTRSAVRTTFVPRGRRRLKGIPEPIAVYAVGAQPRSANRRLVLAAGGGASVLVGVAVLVVALGNRPPAEAIDPSATAALGSPAGSPSTPDRISPAASAGMTAAFPSALEADLLELVEPAYHPRCERSAPGSMPRYWGPGPRGVGDAPTSVWRDPAFAAGVSCQAFGIAAPDELAYWILSDIWVENVEELIANRAGLADAAPGECGADLPAIQTWTAGPVAGRLLCHRSDEGEAQLLWTYSGTEILGRAVRTDGDMNALLRWWNDEARYRRP